MADQANFPDIYLDESVARGGVGSFADPYSDFDEINWGVVGDNAIQRYYDANPEASVTLNLKKGEEWREDLVVGYAGTAAYPLETQAYGTGADPIVNATDLVGAIWSEEKVAPQNIWKTTATISTEPEQVWYDGTYGRRRDEVPTLNEFLSDAATNTNFVCGANFHVRMTFVHEAGQAVYAKVRWVDDNNCIFLRLGGSTNGIKLVERDTSVNDTLSTISDLFSDGVEYTADFTGHGTALKVYVYESGKAIRKASETSAFQQATAQGHFDHDHASIDCDLWSYSFSGGSVLIDEGDWFWDTGTDILYLVSGAGDPYAAFTDPGVEIGARDNCFDSGSKHYLTINGLTLSKANEFCADLKNSQNLNFKNCTTEWAWEKGCVVGGQVTAGVDLLVQDNIFRYCGVNGFSASGASDKAFSGLIVRRNTAYQNGTLQFNLDGDWDPKHDLTGGIKLWCGGAVCSGVKVYENWVYDNGPQSPEETGSRGNGIWYDAFRGAAGARVLTFRNLVEGNSKHGTYLEISQYISVYNNILYNNAQKTGTTVSYGANIAIGSRVNYDQTEHLVYNNSIYGGLNGITCVMKDATTGTTTDITVKNNIVSGCTYAFSTSVDGPDNDGVLGSGNVYTPNCFGAETPGTDFLRWAEAGVATRYDNYQDWLDAANADEDIQTDDNVEADPLYTDPANGDLSLEAGSPCRRAGPNLGSKFEDGVSRTSVFPSDVVIKKHGLMSSAWDMGAIPFGSPGNNVLGVMIARTRRRYSGRH